MIPNKFWIHSTGNLPLLVSDSTNLHFRDALSVAYVTVTKSTAGTKENLFCSNRGNCDTSTGYCQCNPYFDTSNGYAMPGTWKVQVRKVCCVLLICYSENVDLFVLLPFVHSSLSLSLFTHSLSFSPLIFPPYTQALGVIADILRYHAELIFSWLLPLDPCHRDRYCNLNSPSLWYDQRFVFFDW